MRQAACHGTWSGYAATACLQSLFILEAESTGEIYGGTQRVKLGVETLLAILQGESRHADSLRYAVGLLQVEKKFRRSAALQQEVGRRLEEIAQVGEGLEQHEREDLQAGQVSALYSETISHVSPRIVVNGKPQYLQNQRTVNWIRPLASARRRTLRIDVRPQDPDPRGAVAADELGVSAGSHPCGRPRATALVRGFFACGETAPPPCLRLRPTGFSRAQARSHRVPACYVRANSAIIWG
ncbi:MAG: lysogenization regulator HflD [Xanthomonadales bacterium]|nr:lysogenization regulator HflD [Xanthomonadales bacterium]